jgi:hypothetical protein
VNNNVEQQQQSLHFILLSLLVGMPFTSGSEGEDDDGGYEQVHRSGVANTYHPAGPRRQVVNEGSIVRRPGQSKLSLAPDSDLVESDGEQEAAAAAAAAASSGNHNKKKVKKPVAAAAPPPPPPRQQPPPPKTPKQWSAEDLAAASAAAAPGGAEAPLPVRVPPKVRPTPLPAKKSTGVVKTLLVPAKPKPKESKKRPAAAAAAPPPVKLKRPKLSGAAAAAAAAAEARAAAAEEDGEEGGEEEVDGEFGEGGAPTPGSRVGPVPHRRDQSEEGEAEDDYEEDQAAAGAQEEDDEEEEWNEGERQALSGMAAAAAAAATPRRPPPRVNTKPAAKPLARRKIEDFESSDDDLVDGKLTKAHVAKLVAKLRPKIELQLKNKFKGPLLSLWKLAHSL